MIKKRCESSRGRWRGCAAAAILTGMVTLSCLVIGCAAHRSPTKTTLAPPVNIQVAIVPTPAPSSSASATSPNAKATPMPPCPKQCTWNAGADKAKQCWTYMGTAAEGTQGQVVGYDHQTVNGQQCAWVHNWNGKTN